MKTAGRAGRYLLYALVLVLAAGWMVGFDVSIGNPPTNLLKHDPGGLLFASIFIATPWLVAVRLLWRARVARTGVGQSTMDFPARLLALAVAGVPEERRDWGAAMTAELTQVQGPTRLWFAAGCARTAFFPPRANRVPIAVTAGVAVLAVVAAGLAAGRTLPAMRVFAVAFVGLVGGLTLLAVTRSRPLRPPKSRLAVAAAGLTCVVACIAVTGYFLVRYPIGALHLTPAPAIFLAVTLACGLWLTLAPPRGLAADRLSPGVAVGSAVALGAGLLVASRLGLREVAGLDSGIFGYVFFVPPGVIFAAAALASTLRRSLRAGVQTAVLTALLASLVIFAVALMESMRWYQAETSLIYAADGIPLEAVGENIRNFAWGLILLPLWWLPFGVFGAAAGRARWVQRRIRTAK